jgi:hypothetical protein
LVFVQQKIGLKIVRVIRQTLLTVGADFSVYGYLGFTEATVRQIVVFRFFDRRGFLVFTAVFSGSSFLMKNLCRHFRQRT